MLGLCATETTFNLIYIEVLIWLSVRCNTTGPTFPIGRPIDVGPDSRIRSSGSVVVKALSSMLNAVSSAMPPGYSVTSLNSTKHSQPRMRLKAPACVKARPRLRNTDQSRVKFTIAGTGELCASVLYNELVGVGNDIPISSRTSATFESTHEENCLGIHQGLNDPHSSSRVADLTGKTVLITGANTGLGLETCLHLARMNPGKLVLGCRNEDKVKKAMVRSLLFQFKHYK